MMTGGIFNNILNLRKRLISFSSRLNLRLRYKHSIQSKYIYNMNEAYLRYEKGDETFQFTFRYTNFDLNIDKQFMLLRKPAEPIATFLRRLDGNLHKMLTKKQKRKTKKASVGSEIKEDDEKEEDNVESGNIELVRNDSKIDLEETCETLFRDTSEITLKLFGEPYKMKLNVPWVTSMLLPKCILAGFPTYPSDFKTLHTNKEKSQFVWYVNRSKATHASNVYKASWEEVGKGFLYTPTTSEINCRLKLKCTPMNSDQIGPAIEAESSTEVAAGPGPCPFEIRHSFTSEKLTDKNFRITSYNILADIYASTDYSRDVLFPYCPPYALAIDYRKQLIIKELIGYNSDIICLQEVDRKVFDTDLYPILSLLNYDGIFNRKGDDLSEGVAIFYDKRRFEKINSGSQVMSQNVELQGFSNVWEKINNETVKERFLGRNTTIQATILRSKENPLEILVIGNTHLYFQPDADHIRLLQGFYALTYCQDVARQARENSDEKANVNIILCGDFNSTPDCGIYQLMTNKHVPEDHKDWTSNAEQQVENVSLSHESSFASACGTPQYTNFTVEFADCLDYIFYQTDNLEVTQVVPLPSKEELALNQAIPSIVFPSDHIALCADLRWTT